MCSPSAQQNSASCHHEDGSSSRKERINNVGKTRASLGLEGKHRHGKINPTKMISIQRYYHQQTY
jgi:coenzyme F420-reducing hydrogenase delta subunit